MTNIGRNVARQTVSTHFVFPSDIELYPRWGGLPKFMMIMTRIMTILFVNKHHNYQNLKIFVAAQILFLLSWR